jgi:WD40 repeat protein
MWPSTKTEDVSPSELTKVRRRRRMKKKLKKIPSKNSIKINPPKNNLKKGFRIYNCDPFKLTYQREFRSGGLGIVEMLFRCNLMALVGGGKQPRFPPSKVILWDDHQKRAIGELTFRTHVKAVKLRKDCIVAVLVNKVYIYNMTDLQLMRHYETCENEKGLIALSAAPDSMVLACPGTAKGHVQFDLFNKDTQRTVRAVESALACIALNYDGSKLATASEKGTLIRVFSTATSEQTHEVRRGWNQAIIYSLSFNRTSEWIAVSSDKGTVHVFTLAGGVTGSDRPSESEDAEPPSGSQGGGGAGSAAGGGGGGSSGGPPSGNPRSSLSFMANILPRYFASEWSFAQFRVPDKTICTFSATEDNTLIVLGCTGSCWKVRFDPVKGGECIVDNHADFSVRPTDVSEALG